MNVEFPQLIVPSHPSESAAIPSLGVVEDVGDVFALVWMSLSTEDDTSSGLMDEPAASEEDAEDSEQAPENIEAEASQDAGKKSQDLGEGSILGAAGARISKTANSASMREGQVVEFSEETSPLPKQLDTVSNQVKVGHGKSDKNSDIKATFADPNTNRAADFPASLSRSQPVGRDLKTGSSEVKEIDQGQSDQRVERPSRDGFTGERVLVRLVPNSNSAPMANEHTARTNQNPDSFLGANRGSRDLAVFASVSVDAAPVSEAKSLPDQNTDIKFRSQDGKYENFWMTKGKAGHELKPIEQAAVKNVLAAEQKPEPVMDTFSRLPGLEVTKLATPTEDLSPIAAPHLIEATETMSRTSPNLPGLKLETLRNLVANVQHLQSQPGSGPLNVLLQPEELGKVRIILNYTDSNLGVSILAERPETADLFRRNIELLEQEFRALGYSSVGVDLSGQKNTNTDANDASDKGDTFDLAAHSEEVENRASGVTARQHISDGIDVRI